jgi:hypothetical protein
VKDSCCGLFRDSAVFKVIEYSFDGREININMEHWLNNNWQGKTDMLGEWRLMTVLTRAKSRLHCVSPRNSLFLEICALLRHYTASNFNSLPTFRDNVSVSSSRIKTFWTLKMRPICCPETSVKNYHWALCNAPEERRSHQHQEGSMKSLFLNGRY